MLPDPRLPVADDDERRAARHYEVSGNYGPWYVGYRTPGIFHVIAECGVKANAEKIVEALNAR
jgi:hypothetical protein